jgi:nucleoside-triphosphatase THEP1
MSIYIFSRPIHNGKTTELLHWCDQQKNVYGILMPDIAGSRKILDLNSREIFDVECTDTTNTTEPLTTVGRFHFYSAAFEKANSILIDALAQRPGWLLIDEAGKLELERKGFYPAITSAVELYTKADVAGNLLITVRDSLCEEVISFFGIKNCQVILSLDEFL